jgi:hypothetical protein
MKKETWLQKIKFKITYFYENSIMIPIKQKITCLSNLWKWRKVICKDRWWDYSFMLEILLFKLKDMNSHWGTSTHYQGDLDDKKILEELIEDLEWMVNVDDYSPDRKFNNIADEMKYIDEEYKKRSSRFWGRMDRHHRKFWD